MITRSSGFSCVSPNWISSIITVLYCNVIFEFAECTRTHAGLIWRKPPFHQTFNFQKLKKVHLSLHGLVSTIYLTWSPIYCLMINPFQSIISKLAHILSYNWNNRVMNIFSDFLALFFAWDDSTGLRCGIANIVCLNQRWSADIVSEIKTWFIFSHFGYETIK